LPSSISQRVSQCMAEGLQFLPGNILRKACGRLSWGGGETGTYRARQI
jgi:hypothetical protein